MHKPWAWNHGFVHTVSMVVSSTRFKTCLHPSVCTQMPLGLMLIFIFTSVLCNVRTSHVHMFNLTSSPFRREHIAPSRFCLFHLISTPLPEIFTTSTNSIQCIELGFNLHVSRLTRYNVSNWCLISLKTRSHLVDVVNTN